MTNRKKKIITSVSKQYDYTDKELFALGFKSSSEIKEYIRARDFNNMSDLDLGKRKRTLTRQYRLVWQRINEAVNRLIMSGDTGVYEVTRGYYGRTLGHIFAINKIEALETAELFFGYLCAGTEKKVRVKFAKLGSAIDIHHLNSTTKEKIKKYIAIAHASITRCQKSIDDYLSILRTMEIVESQQAYVEASFVLDEFQEKIKND